MEQDQVHTFALVQSKPRRLWNKTEKLQGRGPTGCGNGAKRELQ